MPQRGTAGCIVLAILALVAGCTSHGASDKPPVADGEAIVFGSFLPTTGPSAEVGRGVKTAQEMAVADLNAAGGILGRKLVLRFYDGACDPQQSVEAAQQMIKAGTDVSVGGVCSSSLISALPLLRRAQMPHVEPAANSTDLLHNRYPGQFLMLGTVDDEASAMIPWLRKLDSKNPAIIHDGTSFPTTMADSVVRRWREDGHSTPAVLTLSPGTQSFKPMARKVAHSSADAVVFTGYYAEAGRLVRDLRAEGFDGPVLTGDGSATLSVLTGTGLDTLAGVYFATPPLPETTPLAKPWLMRYRSYANAEPGLFALQGYSAVMVAADSVKRAGSTDSAAVEKALRATRLRTPQGLVEFDKRQVASSGFQFVSITDGKFVSSRLG